MYITRTLLILITFLLFLPGREAPYGIGTYYRPIESVSAGEIPGHLLNDSLLLVSDNFERALREQRMPEAGNLASLLEEILDRLIINREGSIEVSDAYYLLGYYYLNEADKGRSIDYFKNCITIRESVSVRDERYSRCLENVGMVYYREGDMSRSCEFLERSLRVQEEIYGDDSVEMVSTLVNLAASYLKLKKYSQSVATAERGLRLAGKFQGSVPQLHHAALLQSIGTSYTIMADYSRALVYLNQSRSMYLSIGEGDDPNYFRLLNDLANSYWGVSDLKKAQATYEEALTSFKGMNDPDYWTMYDNYANLLWRVGLEAEAEKSWNIVLKGIKDEEGQLSSLYNRVRSNFSYFLSTKSSTKGLASDIAKECYTNSQSENFNLADRMTVAVNYARVLKNSGDAGGAIKILENLEQSLSKPPEDTGESFEQLPWVDLGSLRMYEFWYSCQVEMWRRTGEIRYLEDAVSVSEKLISQIEELRLEMGEEESRLLLGERSELDYKNGVESSVLVYGVTGNRDYAAKAFDFSERSKVSVLLAATRELKATQLHVPEKVSAVLSETQRKISNYRALLAQERFGDSEEFKSREEISSLIFASIKTRDSLISLIEKEYPGYYRLKYDRQTVTMDDLGEKLGGNRSYLSYVLCDTMLFTFVVNGSFKEVFSMPVDSTFFTDVENFRNAVSIMPSGSDARKTFENYTSTGGRLYNTLIAPLHNYIKGENVIINPDNMLSYIPFEALTRNIEYRDGITFRDLPYLMKEFEISYVYSANLLEDKRKGTRSIINRSVSFAPMYTRNLSRDSILSTRQSKSGDGLRPLPYSLEEAVYITDVCNGDLYLNNEASESSFKETAGNYPIVHMAMHTLVNDADPMYSKMLFSPDTGGGDDGQLNTYEIYSLLIPAKMVVLSSCNTGSGKLSRGEGVMSLARGFMYAGSRSVIMALWEVEDRTGTGIVRGFISNLRKGLSKGAAMQKARLDYLEVASQQRSHPYYWATLVVIGENSPIYYNLFWIILLSSLVLITSLGGYFYLRYRSRS